MLNSHPKHSGIYYVKDGIESLQLKIYFRCINTLLKLPKYEFHSKLLGGGGTLTKSTADPTNVEDSKEDDCNVVTIKWQQKLFSETERELYKDLKNCINEQQKKYHHLIKEEERLTNMKEKKYQRRKRHKKFAKGEESEKLETSGSLIFTYIQEDHFVCKEEEDPISKISKEKTMVEQQGSFEVMYVYAALQPDVQLLVLKWFSQQRMLYIYPDFNQFHYEPYYIELDTDYRHLYAYGIEDVSQKLLSSKRETEEFLYLPELSTHWRYEDELSQTFAMPPKRTQRCAILFTINEVSGFDYDNIHVRYSIHLPSNTILEEGLLESATHTASQAKCRTNSTHIGYTWQLTLLCEEQFDPSECLDIYFEIISIDSWLRERSEGYCHYSLRLLKPFHHNVKLQCLLPVETLFDSLNRYFIGGRRKFDYVRFVNKQQPNNTTVLEDEEEEEKEQVSQFANCRYGVRMRNSGHIHLTCQSLTQRNCELLNPCASRTSGMTLDDIMMAYKEARRRLEAIAFK